MEYHKPRLSKSYFGLWFAHLEVMKLACLMHIELLFPVSLGSGSELGEKEEKIANFPLPNPPLGLHRSPIFSYLTPFLLPSSFTAEPGPRLFPVVLCFCRCLWQDLISDAVIVETVFLWPLWSLKLFSTAKEPFVTKISVDFLFSEFEISASEKLHTCSCPWMWWFSGSLLCLTTGPKAK